MEQRKRRSDAAIEAAERRRIETLENVNEIINNMEKPPRLPLFEIRKKALQSMEMKKSENIEKIYSVNDSDEKTITRWMVNYIRHELTDYNLEVEVADMQNTVGRLDAFLAYEEAVYSNIASVYPELKDECERQFAEKREKRIATQMRY